MDPQDFHREIRLLADGESRRRGFTAIQADELASNAAFKIVARAGWDSDAVIAFLEELGPAKRSYMKQVVSRCAVDMLREIRRRRERDADAVDRAKRCDKSGKRIEAEYEVGTAEVQAVLAADLSQNTDVQFVLRCIRGEISATELGVAEGMVDRTARRRFAAGIRHLRDALHASDEKNVRSSR